MIIADLKPIRELEGGHSVEQVIGDLSEHEVMKEALEYKPDGIVHLAAVSRVVDAENDKMRCRRVNEKLTKQLLDGCRRMDNSPWFVYGSSREVYGEQNRLPVPENCVHKPINVYGECKKQSEIHVQDYSTTCAKGMVLRFSNVYGNEFDILDRVVPRFILNAMREVPLEINGGSQVFDFTHISDTVSGIVASIANISGKNLGYFEDVHLLTGKGTTLQELTATISEAIDRPVDVVFKEARVYDVNRFIGDPRKSFSVLGFKANTSISDGVKATIDRFVEAGL